MSDLGLLRVVLVVVEAAAASVLLPPLAWLVAKTWRKSAAGRRLVWITAFAMLVALPALALVAPSLAVIALPAPPPADLYAPVAMPVSMPGAMPVAPPISPSVAAVADPDPRSFGWSFGWADLIPLAAAVWLAGVAKLGIEHLVALARLELMRRSAERWPLPLPVRVRGCDVLVSDDCPGPMTWGVFRPVIMLPDEALDWPAEKLETVLRHEMAHVRRRDGLAQALALLACALYWPNPLVWRAAKALRREAELAADDAVIASGVLPSDYAGQLLELAAEWRERRLTPTGLAMAAPPALSQRVQSILSTDAIRTGATSMDAFKLVLLGGAATAALTLARPSVAEVPTPAPVQHPALGAADAAPDAVQHVEIGHVAPTASDTKFRVPDGTKAAPRYRKGVSANAVQDADAPGVVQFRLHVEPDLELALQDLQEVPAPPAPPAPGAAPAPPTPPRVGLAPLPPGPPRPADGNVFYWRGTVNGPSWNGRLSPQERAELDRKMAAIGPAIDKALKDAHIEETVRKALSAQDAKTREQVARQLAQIGPRIQREIAGAQIGQRFAELQPQIEAQMREQRRLAEERQAQADERVAAQLEEQAKRARERAQRARDHLHELQQAPQPAPAPKN